jgi:tetratricopeptide (TPR) repeat protein
VTPSGYPIAFVAIILCALGVLTWWQCSAYRDSQTFYQNILDRNPSCRMAHINLGVDLDNTGRFSRAIGHYEAALRLRPNYVEAHANLATAMRKYLFMSDVLPRRPADNPGGR